MPVLVDTSVWVEYFRNGSGLEKLDYLLDEDMVVTNKLILVELLPFLKLKKQTKLIGLLSLVKQLPLEIAWDEISEFQYECLKRGINGIGIPDLIIAQNARQNDCPILTRDNHFRLMEDILSVKLS